MAQPRVGGMPVDTVYENLMKTGVSEHDAGQLLGEWLLGGGTAPRTFDYHTAFPATDPACQPHFVRSFHHTDWHDGQDLVQAEQGAGEDGFNLRFHRIENDLDALAADTAELFLCLAEMRQSLRALLDEIKLELNRIDSDLGDLQACCDEAQSGMLVGRGFTGKYLGTSDFLGTHVNVFRDQSGQLFVAPSVNVLPGGGYTDPADRLGRVAALGKYVEETKKVAQAFGKGPLTKEDFVKTFGNDVTSDGYRVGDLVDILPAGARYASPGDLVYAAAEREGAAIRTSGSADAALAGSFALGSEVTNVETAPLDAYNAVPQDARAALVAGGVSTVGDLASMNARTLVTTLKRQGVSVSAGQAGSWIAGSKALASVR